MDTAMVLAFWRFESPGYLALLAVVPLLIALSYRSLAGLGRGRRVAAIVMRSLVVIAIVLALAGAQRTREVDDLSVIFLVDRSKSVPADLQRQAFTQIEQAVEGRRPDDRIGVIAFDGVADVEQTPMKTLALDRISEAVAPDQTDLAAAARMALALLPSETMGRIVLLSDGNENSGDILAEAERLQAAGIPIDILPIRYERENEVVVESMKAPPTAAEGETVNLQVILRSQQPVAGRIRVWHNETLLDLPESMTEVELEPGPNRFMIPVPLAQAGAHRFRAVFEPLSEADDTILDNNEGRSFTVVSGQGKVLILTTVDDLEADPSSARVLARALSSEGLICDLMVAGDRALDPVSLIEYSLVILSNVPAGDFRDAEKTALALYVREQGGGLVMLGGANSFGAGGWLGSPVEEVMPVSFDIKHKKQFIRGALALVMHACEVPKGNYLGERCAIEAVKTLSAQDLVGILAWRWEGGDRGHWVVPLRVVGTRTPIINAIKKMSMGDMPDLDPVMRPGVEALLNADGVGPKHMIVVSDFDPAAPRQDLIKAMQDGGVTCSTIAIGYGGHFIDERKARWIAQSTGGRFYRTNDFSKLPQIFVRESREIRRSLVQEVVFPPQLVDPLSPVVTGLTAAELPDLGGFVLTTARPLADVPIVRKDKEQDDPVLAHWQVGLGRTVAFTSGLWPQWGTRWASWEKFSKFWAQVARWASRQSDSAAFDVSTTVQGGRARIRIDAIDKNADAINFMDVGGTLVDPELDHRPLRLTQTGPGRYEAEFDTPERGNYIVNLAYRTRQGERTVSGVLRTGLSVAYSPEYSQFRPNIPLLDVVRERTGGRTLSAADLADVFDRASLPEAEARHAMWENLVQWMLVLFLLDVAVRRVALHPVELARKLRRRIGEMAGRGRPRSEAAAVLTSLKGSRERRREEVAAERAAEAAERTRAARRYDAPDRKATEDLGKALGGATEQDQPVVARPTRKKPAQSEGDYTARLLRAKRRARGKSEEDQDQQDR
jgi:uncharacterized membrane protein